MSKQFQESGVQAMPNPGVQVVNPQSQNNSILKNENIDYSATQFTTLRNTIPNVDSLAEELSKISVESNATNRSTIEKLADRARDLETKLKDYQEKESRLGSSVGFLDNYKKVNKGPGMGFYGSNTRDFTRNEWDYGENLAWGSYDQGMNYGGRGLQERPTVLQLNPSQPTFSGKADEDVDDWLFITEMNLTAARVRKDEWVRVAIGYLRGEAVPAFRDIWYKGYDNFDSLTWNTFVENMKEKYSGVSDERDYILKLSNLKQKGSVEEYIKQFNVLARKIDDVSENVLVAMFAKGLKVEVAAEVSYRKPKTMKDASSIALAFENKMLILSDRTNANRILDTSDKDGSSWKSPQSLNYMFKRGECFVCGGTGHFANRCPSRFRFGPQWGQPQRQMGPWRGRFRQNMYFQNRPDGDIPHNNDRFSRPNFGRGYQRQEDLRHYPVTNGPPNRQARSEQPRAGEPKQVEGPGGHERAASSKRKRVEENTPMDVGNVTRHQPEGRKDKTSYNNMIIANSVDRVKDLEHESRLHDLIRVEAEVDGIEFEAVLDTGACQSVISKKIADEFEFKYHMIEQEIRVAGGGIIQEVGLTEPIEINVFGVACFIEFLVIPMFRIEVLLGLDWFHETDATIHPKSCSLEFSRKVFLNRESSRLHTTGVLDTGSLDIYSAEIIDEDIEFEELAEWPKVEEKFADKFYSDEIDPDQNELTKSLLREFDCAFAYSTSDLAEPCSLVPVEIRTFSDKPIKLPPYRRAIFENKVIEEEIDSLLKAGIIRPSNSPYAAPAFLVKKKDSGHRMVVDYSELNKFTYEDPLPMPRIDDVLDNLQGSVWFSTIDLKQGFHQIAIHQDSIEKTAFSTQRGHYEYVRLPFGLKNSPAYFNRVMMSALGDLKFVELYVDDIIIHSQDFESHLDHIRTVLERVVKYNLKANPKKSVLFKKKIKILGHVVTNNKVTLDTDKVNTIQKWKSPTNVSQLRSALGLLGYYRRFVKDFSKIAEPMNKLLKKGEVWNWSEDCEKAFQTLRLKMLSYPVLRLPDAERRFYLITDASASGLSAILSQRDDDGADYAVNFASRSTSVPEKKYSPTQLECLALKWGMFYFRPYLYGREFTVITDHVALKWLTSMRNPSGALTRWALYLQSFDFVVEHRAGKIHQNADALSRYGYENDGHTNSVNVLAIEEEDRMEEDLLEDEEIATQSFDPYEDAILLEYLRTQKLANGSGNKTRNRVIRTARKFCVIDDDIFYIDPNNPGQLRLVPPIKDRKNIVALQHLNGHFGALECYNKLKEKYFWRKMMVDITKYGKRCAVCLRHNLAPILEHPAKAQTTLNIFDRCSIDLAFVPIRSERGYIGVMVITEFLSDFPVAMPIKSKNMNEIVGVFFNYCAMFGAPKEILTDQGKEFVNSLLSQLRQLVGTEHRLTSAYNPRTNGKCERMNKILINIVKKHAEENPEDWDLWIPFALMAYRSKINRTTKYSPFKLMFGREMNMFGDWAPEINEDESTAITKRAMELEKMFDSVIPEARGNVESAKIQQRRGQNQRSNILNEPLAQGTVVYVRVVSGKGKLEPHYIGPYRIHGQTANNNYWLINRHGKTLKTSYPVTRLKVVDVEDAEEIKEDVEVERILKHRKRNGEFEYLVKWTGHDESENEWVRASDFNTTEIIEEYHAKIASDRGDESSEESEKAPKKRGRPQGSKNKPKSNNVAMTVALIFLILPCILGKKIEDNFKFCTVNDNSPVLDASGSCKTFQVMSREVNQTFTLLDRRKYLVNGRGFMCEAKKISQVTWKDWWFSKIKERSEHVITLTRDECSAMVIAKNCFGNKMECEGSHCRFEEQPYEAYYYLHRTRAEIFHCESIERHIFGTSLDQPLFAEASSSCRATDLYCHIPKMTIIWGKEIIQTCPLYKITTMKFNVTENLVVGDKALFQIIGKRRECDMEVLETTEGILLSKDPKADELPNSSLDFNPSFHILLSDIDLKTFNLLNTFNMISSKTNEHICNTLKSVC